jgi:Tol biopolymer transport system component
VFASNRRSGADIYHKAASGAGSEEPLHLENGNEYPLSWSRDGRSILYGRNAPGSGVLDLWVLPLEGKPSPFLQTPFNKEAAALSPDGRWAAYVSNESGRNEVYVTSFPMPAGRWQVSTAGGSWPRWRRDGRELFYLAPDNRLMAADVHGQGSSFQVGTVPALFQTQARTNVRYMYDVSPDGQRFLINTLVEQAVQPITLVVNWTAALRK